MDHDPKELAVAVPGFPRRRGDGPRTGAPVSRPFSFPPQARGWTVEGEGPTDLVRVSPAGAGMDPSRTGMRSRSWSFPRRRGDGPFAPVTASSANWFPPQARGWTPRIRSKGSVTNVSPAGAGMDRRPRHHADARPGFPRRRGDGPPVARPQGRPHPFPPQARGWTQPPLRAEVRPDVSPAGAGMDPSAADAPRRRPGFPRRRGDGPSRRAGGSERSGFPPQARGWTAVAGVHGQLGGVSPAGAGMDPSRRRARRRCPGFPRRRGDGPTTDPDTSDPGEFPPQARGWTAMRGAPPAPAAVSPAGAGMDRRNSRRRRSSTRFPRRRGDGPSSRSGMIGYVLFPPQARGWTVRPGDRDEFRGVSPAGAGMDPAPDPSSTAPGRFPRRRGDGPLVERLTDADPDFPPQARGWTRLGKWAGG